MIRAVLDTNILASGVLGLTGGVTPPALLLHQWRAGRFRLIISNYIEEELRKTLDQPYFKRRIRSEDRELFLILLSKFAEHVAIRRRVTGVATHPEDDPILATALSAHADYLVTGDLRLQRRVPSFQGIPLVLAADFLDILNREL
jgi:putative PIN family toxin of toxin-antitoxin system